MTQVTRLTIKVFGEGNSHPQVIRLRAMSGKVYHHLAIQNALHQVACHLETKYPDHIFETVRTGRGKYNIVHRGKHERREVPDAPHA